MNAHPRGIAPSLFCRNRARCRGACCCGVGSRPCQILACIRQYTARLWVRVALHLSVVVMVYCPKQTAAHDCASEFAVRSGSRFLRHHDRDIYTDIPHIPSKFMEFVPLSHRQGNCIPYAAIRWHDFGNRPALGRPLGHFSRHPDTPLLSLSPRRRFPRPTPERVFVADHQSSSGFSGTGPSAPPPQPIGT